MILSTPTVSQGEQFARAVSRLFGWIYTLCWSLSFYPQPLLNYRRRSTVGAVIDFSVLNILGFLVLTISNLLFLCSPTIRRQYAARHPLSPESTVRWNDLAYAVHAQILTALTFSQYFLWGFEVGESRRVGRPALVVFWGCVAAVLAAVVSVAWQPGGGAEDPFGWAWIDVAYLLSYVKLIVTIAKYIPQVYLNHKKRSTVGWSIDQILLDSTGAVLSLAQLVIDSSWSNDWSGVTGNPIKFGLANVTLAFDVVFILQEYCLYGKRGGRGVGGQRGRKRIGADDEEDERRPLLQPTT